MRRRSSRFSPFAVGAAVIIIGTLLIALAVRKDIPFINEPHTLKAAFRDSQGLRNGSPVRIAGVEVGKVIGVEHGDEGTRTAIVEMEIRENGLPIHRDAQLAIRPRIFLEGNFFIELEPGSPGADELDSGALVPADQTTNAVQLDEVLKILTSDVRNDLRSTFDELGKTQEAGGGRAINRSLRSQPAAYRYSAIVAEALLGERDGDLGDLVRDQGAVAEALTDPGALRDLVVNFNTTAAALAGGEADLRAAIRELPATLAAGTSAFAELDEAFPPLRRFARVALPAVRSTGPAVDAILPLVRQLRGLVSSGELRGLSGDLRTLVGPATLMARRTVPLLGELRALSSCANEVLVPFGEDRVGDPKFEATGPVHQEFPKSLVGLAGESRSHDANGQWFKVLGTGGLETFSLGNGLLGTTSTPMRGINPPARSQRPPLRRDVACETQEPPDLRSSPDNAPRSVPTDRNSPAAKARERKARAVAVDALRRQLRGGGDRTRVLPRAATRAEVAAAAKRGPGG